MDTGNNANADANEPGTSDEKTPSCRESKNQGAMFNPSTYTDTAQQQSVSRSSEPPEGLEPDMNDVQIGQTSSSPGKGKFSTRN